MTKITSPVIRDECTELNNTMHDDASDTESANPSTNTSTLEEEFAHRDKTSSKSSMSRSDKGSSPLEDGLPGDDSWAISTSANLKQDPFFLTRQTYPVFESGGPILTAEWLQILQAGNKRYPLRNTNRSTFRGSGFLDLDKSGDYSDEKPERFQKPQKTRVRRIPKTHDLDNAEDDEAAKLQPPRTLSYGQGRKNGRNKVLRLNISSDIGLEKFIALTRKCLSSDECTDDVLQEPYQRSLNDSAHRVFGSPFKGRTGVTTRISAANANEKIHDHSYRTSEDTYDNILGHPEARGCRDCYDLGIECSLIDNYLSYPCDNCYEDGQDCILITPRKEKRPCEQCRHKRLQCSYVCGNEQDSITACYNCQDAGVMCIAGPAKSYRIDDVLASLSKNGNGLSAAVEIQYLLCTKCHKNKIRSSPENLGQSKICRQCLIGRESATPEASPESIKAAEKHKSPPKRAVAKPRAQLHLDRNRSLSLSKDRKGSARQKKSNERIRSQKLSFKLDSDIFDEKQKPKFSASVPGGKIMYITTSYCHPIHFNWIPPPPLPPSPHSPAESPSGIRASSFPCHFCTDPGLPYAIAGLGSKRVEVIQWQHDLTAGYEELEDGWVQAGQEGTRMCTKCTLERMLICFCAEHLIRPIKGLNPRTFDYEGAMQGLVNQILNRGKPDHEKLVGSAAEVADVKWCSICPQPAFFECCVRPAFTSSGLETSPSDDIGCGLLLCEVCASRMRGRSQHHHGVPAPKLTLPGSSNVAAGPEGVEQPVKAIMTLDEHIRAAEKDTFHYHDGVRADACFLKADSELIRRQGVYSEDGAGGADDEQNVDEEENSEYYEFQDRAFKKRYWGMGSPIDLT